MLATATKATTQPPVPGPAPATALARAARRSAAGPVPRAPDDALGAVLQRAVLARTARPVLQRMRLQDDTKIDTLADLNNTLAGFAGLFLGGVAMPAGTLPLGPAAFAPPSSGPRIAAAIRQSGLELTDYMEVQDVIDAVNAILAVPLPAAAATFDKHGWKHFGGGNGVAQGGDQWGNYSHGQACTLMVAEIGRIEQHLRAHAAPNAQGVTTYYYTTRAPRNVGKAGGSQTTKYSIQIDYHVDDNTVVYHGYPDTAVVPLGLGRGKANKDWPNV